MLEGAHGNHFLEFIAWWWFSATIWVLKTYCLQQGKLLVGSLEPSSSGISQPVGLQNIHRYTRPLTQSPRLVHHFACCCGSSLRDPNRLDFRYVATWQECVFAFGCTCMVMSPFARVNRADCTLGLCGRMWSWLSDLSKVFGWPFLMTVFYYHHILKGFVLMYVFTSFDWVLASQHVRGPRLQALKTIALLPWVLKPVLGIISDMFPVFGRSKAPYFIMGTLVGCPACAFVGLHHHWDMQSLAIGFETAIVAAFFCIGLQICICDLLLEAAVAERIRKTSKKGPSLMAFVTGGQTIGEAIAISSVGSVLEHLGPQGPCLLAVPFTLFAFIPAVGNWLGEPLFPQEAAAQRRAAFFKAKNGGGEIPLSVAAMGIGSMVILYVATNTDVQGPDVVDPLSMASFQLKLITFLAILIISAFGCLLNPTIGLMNAFFFLQSTSTISVEGGAFYFFTDDSTSYPMGPHFSVWFYTTGLGLAASGFGIMGLWIYNHFMTHWRFRNLLLTSNLLWSLVSAVSVLVFMRKNVEWGVPDDVFVLGGTVLQNVFARWAYVPGGLLLCQVCPAGLEATMFALLAGCQNLGRSVASIFGTYLLAYLGVEPDGTVHDRHCFDRLWVAAVLQSLAPILTLALLPRMIPDASQTDNLCLTPEGPVGDTGGEFASNPSSSVALATSGSLWKSLRLGLLNYFQPTLELSDVGTGVSYGTTTFQAGKDHGTTQTFQDHPKNTSRNLSWFLQLTTTSARNASLRGAPVAARVGGRVSDGMRHVLCIVPKPVGTVWDAWCLQTSKTLSLRCAIESQLWGLARCSTDEPGQKLLQDWVDLCESESILPSHPATGCLLCCCFIELLASFVIPSQYHWMKLF